MSRDLSTVTLESIQEGVVYPFFAVELLFDGSNTIRMWTGQGTLNLEDGTEWIGLGSLLDISTVEETAEMAVKGATITLSGVSSEALSLALSEPYQGRVCNIYFGTFKVGHVLQESGSFILQQDGSKIQLEAMSTGFNQLFSGYMDQMNISDGGDTCNIELMVENRLIDLERARVARFTSGYQKSIYPDDLGLDFIEDLQDKDISWGRKSGS
ncbi:hypothetical protein N9796_00340 [bacterium]|nr:hypothetical protein [bacterium]MDB4277770.1 hypothetical protein [Gammaproteobacteria bacterium]MDB4352533.1 hypothetical protein [Porticoccaceae bacterium]MDB9844225.1 hypothetical protein [Porticoccaceae bacterium]|tara:strand:+ start:1068 stop:1703 length:636 start_codon:yes stop_codon:yes gene_type:complete